ncbi:hypothetical protein Dvina_02030 [Dactylosporangium vinaceum]|uniref:Uncharacterized protein n=1 Tax=Dactylosporangium vinaceum TaxID=53362 RepID=A0ABV5MF30_9ACTN|nr:hypothetical protein [Dactylosporangium vinaceum]UAB97015.1 hypothetical protein Dvina_02030 [Dactylosporangium vinaceum]
MRLRQAFTAATVAAVGLMLVVGTGAYAAGQASGKLVRLAPCSTVRHGNTEGILTTSNGEAPSPTNPNSTAVLTLQREGVDATLPDNSAKALYLEEPSRTVKLNRIGKLTYRTVQLAQSGVAVWSYQIPIDINGGTLQAGDFTTLVYEPYQDGQTITPGKWQNWDALRKGQAKWWSTRALTNVANGATQTFPTAWSTIIAAYPDATVLAYGLDLGKGAPGASSRVDSLTFGADTTCAQHRWSTRFGRTSHPLSLFQIWRKWLLR